MSTSGRAGFARAAVCTDRSSRRDKGGSAVSTPEVNERVKQIFVDALNIQVPSEDTDLIEGGYIDSLALVELLFAIEREFSVTVPLDELDIDNFRNVRRISELVAANGRPT